jgi:hypothetical protein
MDLIKTVTKISENEYRFTTPDGRRFEIRPTKCSENVNKNTNDYVVDVKVKNGVKSLFNEVKKFYINSKYTPIELDLTKLKHELNTNLYKGDISDIGNEIGIMIGRYNKDVLSDFMNGLRHGISLSDGTH